MTADLYAELLAERFGPTWKPTPKEPTPTTGATLQLLQGDDPETTARRRAVLAEAFRETGAGAA